MRTFKLGDKEYNICTSWSELTLRQYINLVKTQQKEGSYPIKTLFMLSVFEILCNAQEGELNDLTIESLGELTQDMGFISKLPKLNKVDHFQIDGVDYAFAPDINTLKMDEVIAVQLLQKQYEDNPIDFIPKLLSVLLRPAKKVYFTGSSKYTWVLDKFDNKDLEYRTELLLDKCKGVDVVQAADFFLNGKQTLIKPSKNSRKEKLTVELNPGQKN